MPTPSSDIMLKVPAGSAPGRELRIKGRGIPASDPGDLYAVLKIVLPAAGDAGGKAAYEAFAKSFTDFNPRAKFGGVS
jgi:curved DNA-binding protein